VVAAEIVIAFWSVPTFMLGISASILGGISGPGPFCGHWTIACSRLRHRNRENAMAEKRRPDCKYTPELAAEICERLAEGQSLREICRSPHIPVAEKTVRNWALTDREGFAAQYARARELLHAHWADEIIDIADDGVNDFMERRLKDGTLQTKPAYEVIQRSALRVDARKWLLSKLHPEQYGERKTTTLTGPGGGPIQQQQLADRPAPEDNRPSIASYMAQFTTPEPPDLVSRCRSPTGAIEYTGCYGLAFGREATARESPSLAPGKPPLSTNC
jgi:hypothetical protein